MAGLRLGTVTASTAPWHWSPVWCIGRVGTRTEPSAGGHPNRKIRRPEAHRLRLRRRYFTLDRGAHSVGLIGQESAWGQ